MVASEALKTDEWIDRKFWQTASVADITRHLDAGADIRARHPDYEETLLHMALEAWNLPAIKELIAQGANVKAKDFFGHTPLHLVALVCGPGAEEVARELIQRGANVNAPLKGDAGTTPLHCLVIKRWDKSRQGVMEALLKADANIHAQTRAGATPVSLASIHCQEDAVGALTTAGATIESLGDRPENVALRAAARTGQTEIVAALLADGVAEIDSSDQNGDTALHLAALGGHLETAKALIAAGANGKVANAFGDTALHLAVLADNASADIIDLLVAAGADVNAKDDQGCTPLHKASYQNLEATEALRAARADTEALDAHGRTPLFWAATMGDVALIQAFLDAEAVVDARDSNGETALFCAADTGSEHAVKALLDGGAKVNVSNHDGETALFRAADRGSRGNVKALLDGGADSKVKNNEGKSPIDYVDQARHPEIAAMLTEKSRAIDGRPR